MPIWYKLLRTFGIKRLLLLLSYSPICNLASNLNLIYLINREIPFHLNWVIIFVSESKIKILQNILRIKWSAILVAVKTKLRVHLPVELGVPKTYRIVSRILRKSYSIVFIQIRKSILEIHFLNHNIWRNWSLPYEREEIIKQVNDYDKNGRKCNNSCYPWLEIILSIQIEVICLNHWLWY